MSLNLIITQAPSNGILGGPFSKKLVLTNDGIDYAVSIEQMGVRTIEISSTKAHSAKDVLSIYYRIVTLLMLFDGKFYPIIEAADDVGDITVSMQERELASYKSADFMLGTGNALLNPFPLLSAQLIDVWNLLENNLDMVHKMFLYCVSNVEMPVDMKCAFLIETYIGLAELIASKKADFILPAIKSGESKLQKYLTAVIGCYGNDIFESERKLGLELFSGILKESRNRIAHIKEKRGKLFLNGAESVLYLCKLSMLYRIVLLDLLGIPSEQYESNVKKRVESLNNWNGVLDAFLVRSKVAI